MDSKILIEKDNAIAYVTLNNIAKHNAFDDKIIAELTEQFELLAACKSTRVIILQANGKHFCAGADLAWMKRMKDYSFEENQQDSHALAKLLQRIYHHPKPVIASIKGCAFGGGVGLIAACDIAIATEQSSFCFSETKLGLLPAVISPYVVKAIGERHTKKLFLTAEIFSAATARDLYLLHDVCTEETLKVNVKNVAEQIIQNGPNAVRSSKQLINDTAPLPITEAILDHTSERIATLRVSQEGQEGLSAFFEKRAPNWK